MKNIFRKIRDYFGKGSFSASQVTDYNNTIPREVSIYSSLKTLTIGRERLRAAYHNNDILKGALRALSTLTLGETGLRLDFAKGEGAASRNDMKKIRTLWSDFSESLIDSERSVNLLGLQHQVMNSTLLDGFVFVQVLFSETAPVVKIYTAEALAINLNANLENGSKIRLGVEYDSNRIKKAYYIRMANPQDNQLYQMLNFADTIDSCIRFPIEDLQQIYLPERVALPFGIPYLFPSFLAVQSLTEFKHSELNKQRLASSINAFAVSDQIESESPFADVAKQLETADDGAKAKISLPFSSVERLRPGEKVEFPDAPRQVSLEEFCNTILMGLSMSTGISREVLLMDFSRTSYSSSRMANIVNNKTLVLFRDQLIKSQLLNFISSKFLDFHYLNGNVSSSAFKLRRNYTSPYMRSVDPVKEAKADEINVRTGTTSLTALIKSKGLNPEDVFSEIIEEREKYPEIFKFLADKNVGNENEDMEENDDARPIEK